MRPELVTSWSLGTSKLYITVAIMVMKSFCQCWSRLPLPLGDEAINFCRADFALVFCMCFSISSRNNPDLPSCLTITKYVTLPDPIFEGSRVNPNMRAVCRVPRILICTAVPLICTFSVLFPRWANRLNIIGHVSRNRRSLGFSTLPRSPSSRDMIFFSPCCEFSAAVFHINLRAQAYWT